MAALAMSLSYCLLFPISGSFWQYAIVSAIAGGCYTVSGIVLISLLIHNWFPSHTGFFLGLSVTGSGISTIIAPPVLTHLVEQASLSTAFRTEGAFFAVVALFLLLFLRDAPKYRMRPERDQEDAVPKPIPSPAFSRSTMGFLLAAIFLMGAATDVGFSHISILLTTAGYDHTITAAALSIVGISLMIGKCLFGSICDHWNSRQTLLLFLGLVLLGSIGCCLAAFTLRFPVLLAAMIVYGAGLSVSSVGISICASDFSTPETFSTRLELLQFFTTIGMLFCGPLPGLIADRSQSYIPAYIAFSLFSLFSLLLLCAAYRCRQSVP